MPLFIVEFLYWSAHFELSVILELSSASGKWYAEADLVHVPYRVSVCWIASCFFFLVARVTITEHIGLAFYRYQYLLSVCFLFPPLRLHRWWIGVHYRAWNGGAIYKRLSFMGELLPFFYDPRTSRYLQMFFKTAVIRGSFLFYELFGRLRICRVSFEQRFCNLELDVVLLMLFSRLFSSLFFYLSFSLLHFDCCL